MIRRRRYLLLALLALTVPLPALGVSSGSAATLSVSATLDQCGVATTTVVCKFDATYSSVPGAHYYTASVTSPNGSVVDFGNVAAGATSLWVPYVGNGTYTVSVSAWGDPRANENPKPIATGSSSSSSTDTTSAPGATKGSASGSSSSSARSSSHSPGQGTGASSASGDGDFANTDPGTASGETSTTPTSTTATTTTTPTTTTTTPATTTAPDPGDQTCTPQPAPPPPTTTTSSDANGSSGINGVSPQAADSMSTSGELPSDSAEPQCPDGTTPQPSPNGPCCPTPSG